MRSHMITKNIILKNRELFYYKPLKYQKHFFLKVS